MGPIEDLREILRQFRLEEAYPEILEPTELPGGYINSTYKIEARGAVSRRYILQKINTFVFRRPVELMENVVSVTGYIRGRIAAGEGIPGQRTLTVYPALDGAWMHIDAQGGCWRCYNCVDDAYSPESAASEGEAYGAGKAFGAFLRMLDGYPIEGLHETIPDFHNTPRRYENLEAAAAKDEKGRCKNVEAELAFACARRDDCAKLLNLVCGGEIPVRVTHNDTKINNVLFDQASREPVCVVDLDTIMPGLSHYDYGDSLRSLGMAAAEDERDLSLVDFSMPLFRAYTRGFLESAAAALTPAELRWLPFGVKLMTFECGMRFLTDYLSGDVYFRVRKPDDNLARCRTQFRLVEKIEQRLPEMEDFVRG